MASTMTPAHSPAVNHPSQGLAGFSATHSLASDHFVTEAVRHGSSTVSASVIQALEAPLSGWGLGGTQTGAGGTTQYFVPNGATNVPGSNPSYIHNADGTYTFNGNSGTNTSVTSPTLAGAMAQWLANNAGSGTASGGTTNTGTTTPFDTLATLLTSLAGQTPVATTVPADSAGTSVPTTSSPSLVIPLLLVLLAAGIGYWYFVARKKHAHAGAAAH